MTGNLPTGRVPGTQITAHPGAQLAAQSWGQWQVTVNGKPARLAIVTDDGQVVADGPEVAQEVRAVALNAFANFWKGLGHLRVVSNPIAAKA